MTGMLPKSCITKNKEKYIDMTECLIHKWTLYIDLNDQIDNVYIKDELLFIVLCTQLTWTKFVGIS